MPHHHFFASARNVHACMVWKRYCHHHQLLPSRASTTCSVLSDKEEGGHDKMLHPWELVYCKHKQQASCREGIRSSVRLTPGSAQLACRAEPCTQLVREYCSNCMFLCVDCSWIWQMPKLVQKLPFYKLSLITPCSNYMPPLVM